MARPGDDLGGGKMFVMFEEETLTGEE